MVFLLSLFIRICRRAVSAVGCCLPPFQFGLLHFKNSDWRKKEWHTTTEGRTGNGLSGKKQRKKYCGNIELMKPPPRKFEMRPFAKRRGQAHRNNKKYLDVLTVHTHNRTYPAAGQGLFLLV